MISLADEKAALAWLDVISAAVDGADPHAILEGTGGAIALLKQLRPETPEEYEAIRNCVDAIASAQIHAVRLLHEKGEIGDDD